MNMVTTYICPKENALFKEEIKKLLKKLHHQPWMRRPERGWVHRLSSWLKHVVTKAPEQ
jgi:hypothetical protein